MFDSSELNLENQKSSFVCMSLIDKNLFFFFFFEERRRRSVWLGQDVPAASAIRIVFTVVCFRDCDWVVCD
jgi:hypothetical protein